MSSPPERPRPVKVGLLGNMNNNHYAMTVFLRDRGIDADLLMFRNEFGHFHPSADSFDLSYQNFTKVLGWGSVDDWFGTSDATIKSDLNDYDVLIGCGLAPAYCHRIGRPLDIFVPYGSDLQDLTHYSVISPLKLPALWTAVTAQRRGIRECRIFQMDATNPIYEGLWETYRGHSERWRVGPPMVNTKVYNPENVARVANRTHWSHEFAAVRAQNDLVLFAHARHVWGGDASDPNQKGTNRLLQGFALFRKKHPGVKAALVTLEYGSDVAKSKQLITQLGIANAVHWFPMMYRKDLMVGLLNADIVCGEFENSWLSSGVIYEALAMARPILGFRQDELYDNKYPSLYPILNAKAPEEICARLEEYVSDRSRHEAMGEEGRAWYERFVVDAALSKYTGYIATATDGAQ